MAPGCACWNAAACAHKDLDFERREILLRNGKGRKDRVTMLPEILASDLTTHLEGVQELHCKDLADGMGS